MTSAEVGAATQRTWRVVAFAAVALVVLVLLADPIRPWWENNTDAHAYAETAHQMIRGHGYVMLDGYQERYPPGWPALLAPVTLVGHFPGNVQVFARLTGVVLLGLVWWAAKKIGGYTAAATAALMCVGSKQMLEHSRQVISDVPTTCLIVGALVAMLYGRELLAGVLMGYSVAMRLASAIFLPSLLPSRRAMVGAVLVLVPLAVFQMAVYGSLSGYGGSQAGFAVSALWEHHAMSVRGVVVDAGPNWMFYGKVLLGWGGWAIPGVALLGGWGMWLHRHERATRWAASVAALNVAGFLFYTLPAARFMLPTTALLTVYAGAAVAALLRMDHHDDDAVGEGQIVGLGEVSAHGPNLDVSGDGPGGPTRRSERDARADAGAHESREDAGVAQIGPR